ncbi:MAG: GNAT family N-acetyltransferase [Dehalococcoidia bacterium]|nr:GNAT family N-acetyltransferase [Dehalococcoidia bacterium]
MPNIEIRVATEADAATLSEIERRSPLVADDHALVIDRGDDYFAAARLMEDETVLLAEVDGEPAGVLCGARHLARVGGRERQMLYIHHVRILPEFQRHGLGRALSARAQEVYRDAGFHSMYWYISKTNARSQRFASQAPNKWSFGPLMVELGAAPFNGDLPARTATPGDAETIVTILNAAHENEEMFLPYTVERLRERLERAPAQYSWPNIWLTEGAVVGAWPEGDYVSTVVLGADGEKEFDRGSIVVDYGCLPGREGELVALLEVACGWANERGYQSVTIFTSPGAQLHDAVVGMAENVVSFDFWTPGFPEPEGAARRGIYVDPVYF